MRHHKLLEQDAINIDEERARLAGEIRTYEKYGQRWEEAMPLKEDKQHLKTCVFFCTEKTQRKEKRKFEKSLDRVKCMLRDIKEKKTKTRGPVMKAVQSVLDKHNIVKQAYHGGNFIGNHCHRYLVQNIYKELTKEVIYTVAKNTLQDQTIAHAFRVESKYNKLNEDFRNVHIALSHARPVTQDDINEAELAVKQYMTTYRRTFPHSITPKHHILEKLPRFYEKIQLRIGISWRTRWGNAPFDYSKDREQD